MTYKVPTITAGTSGTGTTASLSIARPSGLRVGDLLLLVIATEGAADSIEVPAGFVPVIAELSQGSAINLGVWTKFSAHNEPATYSVTLGAADDSLYNLLIVRGADPWSVVHVTDVAQGAAGLPLAEPGGTTTVDNCLAIGILAMDGSPRVIAAPTGWTLIDSEDGPAASISWGLAKKTIATAGASGGANWTATDSTSGDYLALTLAIKPGVMGRDYSILYAPQQLLAKTLADCTEFRNLVGAADHAAAFARIWHESLPPPAGGAQKYDLSELQAYRPYALVFLRDPDGMTGSAQSALPGVWADRGIAWIRLVFSCPAGLADNPTLLDHLVKQLVGRIMRRPPDETSGSFYGLTDLAGRTNETDGYSYLATETCVFKTWAKSSDADEVEQGAFLIATIQVTWGREG
jgi:hypothetical protein